MRWIYPVLFLAAVFLLGADKCQDNHIPPVKVSCSIYADGSHFQSEDESMSFSTWGRPFDVSEDMVIHLGSHLYKSVPGGNPSQFFLGTVSVTDYQFLGIDRARQMLYFGGDHSIYRIGFNGQNCTRVSPEDGADYSAPALSSCGNYLIAIRDKHIARMNIQTGEWIVLPEPTTAMYATYIGDIDEYYYYSHYVNNYQYVTALCRLDAEADSTMIFTRTYSPTPDLINAQISPNHRYFALHIMKEPHTQYSWTGDQYIRSWSDLKVYDRQTGQTITVPGCYSYTFSQESPYIIFSRDVNGMADLMLMNLDTHQSHMIWDGYYEHNVFSYSISEIYPVFGGQKIYLKAWKRNWKSDDDKSLTAPMVMDTPLNDHQISER